jgi:2,3-bisphosphoglycerate-independent phosphoglycerate mutase
VLKHYKGLMIILDGLGDRRIAALGGKTPLETANTPNMDRLATSGQCGLVDPMRPGVPLGTHTGTGLLLGLPPSVAAELARGPVEAAGIGIADDPDAIYLRCNLATLEKRAQGLTVIDRRAGRIGPEAAELSKSIGTLELSNGMLASLHPATQHRAVLKLSGGELSMQVTNSDPGNNYQEKGLVISQAKNPMNDAAVRTAAAINQVTQLVFERLQDHPVNIDRKRSGKPPANGIICRGPGRLPRLQTQIQRLGVKTAVVSGEKTVLGLAAMLNYTQITDDRFTSLPNTDLEEKVRRTLSALESHDLVYLHIKGTDICSHDQRPSAKAEMLERIDAALSPLLGEELVIAITGDHSTDSNTGRHCGDPVPTLLCSPTGRVDTIRTFNEAGCAQGGMGRISSNGLLTSLLDMMNLLENYHPDDATLYQ